MSARGEAGKPYPETNRANKVYGAYPDQYGPDGKLKQSPGISLRKRYDYDSDGNRAGGRATAESRLTGRQELEKRRDELVERAEDLKKAAERLTKMRAALLDAAENLRRRAERAAQAMNRVNGLEYRACPNGHSFSQCDHTAAKRRFLQQREKARDLVVDEVRAAQRESDRIKRELSRLGEFDQKLGSARRNLLEEARRWDEDVARFRKRQSAESGRQSGRIGFDDSRPKAESAPR